MSLKVLKLTKEIEGMEPDGKNRAEKFVAWLTKNLGYITTVAVLVAGVVNPVANYIANQRKAQLIGINEKLLPILDFDTQVQPKVAKSSITELAAMDPVVIVPILLNRANTNEIHLSTAQNILMQMYSLNRKMPHYSLSDRILFIFVRTNADILEQEILDNAEEVFAMDMNSDNNELYRFYIDLLAYIRKINPDFDFDDTLDLIRTRCQIDSTPFPCGHAKETFPDKF